MKHGHGNDGLAMPASVAHRGMDLFGHRHGGEERGDGHQHHQSPATASDPQDGLIAVVGGSAMAVGTPLLSVVSLRILRRTRAPTRLRWARRSSRHRRIHPAPAAPPPLPTPFSTCRAPISSSSRKSGNRSTHRTHGWSPRTVRSSSSWISPSVAISRLGRNRSRARLPSITTSRS